jgi:hypothetical protein
MPIGAIEQQHKVFREGLADRLAAQAGKLLEMVAILGHRISVVVAAEQALVEAIQVCCAFILADWIWGSPPKGQGHHGLDHSPVPKKPIPGIGIKRTNTLESNKLRLRF